MFLENFERQNEDDVTKKERAELVAELESLASADDKKFLEKFKKGVFLIPGETINKVVELMDKVDDKEKKKKLLKLYHEIMEQA